jgi:2-methylcitrate dehydratase PrpD
MNESRTLAAFLAETRYESLPLDVVAAAKLAVLDWIGSALAGSLEGPAVIAREIVAGFGESAEASLFPAGRCSAAGAALANGVASHILELDDIHKGSTIHGAAPIIPAALAVAEREGADGRAFLLAAALGYEAALRIGEAVNPSHYRYWHPTGTAATFGAAAATGSVLGLDGSRMLDALGSAGTQAAGLWEFNADGAMSKHLHPGKAAFNGVIAADLAKRGFSAASKILEGERGFFAAMSNGADANRITDELGVRWKLPENGYKLHSCCGHTHTAVDSAIAFRQELGWGDAADAAARVQSIEIALYGPGYAIVQEPNPQTPYHAKFSAAYCVAAGLSEGRVGLEQFSDDRFDRDGVRDSEIARVMQCTSVRVDDELSIRYPERWPSRVTLRLDDGRVLERENDFPLGHPENPVAVEALEQKARDLIAPRFGGTLADAVVELTRDLEFVPNLSKAMNALLAASTR